MIAFLQTLQMRASIRYWLPKAFLATLVCGLLSAPALQAQTALSGSYNVCSSCTYTTPQQIADSLSKNGVSGAVTVNIAAGTYSSTISISSGISGASSTNTITFKGAGASGSSVTKITGSSGDLVSLSSVKYVNFQNIRFDNSSSSSGNAASISSSSYINFTSCYLSSSTSGSKGSNNVYLSSSSYVTFDKCEMRGGFYGFYNYFSGYTTVKNSILHDAYQYNYYSYYGYNNVFDKNNLDSLQYQYGYAMYSYYDYGCSFTNSYIAGGEFTMYMYAPNAASTSNEYLIANNMIVGNTNPNYDLLYVTYSGTLSNSNLKIAHNSFYGTQSNSTSIELSSNNSHGIIIANNNFTANSSLGDPLVYFHYALNAANGDKVEGNNFYTQGSGPLVYMNGSYIYKFSDYLSNISAWGLGQNEQNIATTFVSGTDLHYTSSSTLPIGIYVGIDKDIDGDSRCKLFPTTGADEGKRTSSKPTSSFTGPSKIVDRSPVTFKNGSSNRGSEAYRWYVNGKYVSDSFNLYTIAMKAPSSTVTLVTENCGGKDSLTKTFTVDSPKKAPVTDFIANLNVIRIGDVVKFNDLSTNYPSSWSWSISPNAYNYYGSKIPTFVYTVGDSSQPNPSIRFDYPGKYKICLSTSNIKGSGGTECKADYVEVLGSYSLSGGKTVINQTRGYLYDAGGPNGNYYSGGASAVIDPGCAKTVYLVFNTFDLYCGYDFIRIYDGPDNKSTSTELTPCTSNINYGVYGPGLTGGPSTTCYTTGIVCIPKSTDTFKATSGKMFIQMNAVIGGRPGFEAYFWSDPKAQKPAKASFTSMDSVCTNASVDFINSSTGDDLSYQWDMDGDYSYFEDTRKNTSYPFIFPGQYTITLIAKNCASTDTFQKTITVFDPPAPKATFHADNTNPTKNDVVYLFADSKGCIDDYKWTIKKKYGAGTVTYLNGTTSASAVPQVMLSDTGCYDVTFVASNVSGADSSSKKCYIFVKEPYCVPSITTPTADLGISEVQLSTINGTVLINNVSKQTGSYENYTPTVSANLEIGVSYPFTISRNTNNNKAVRTIYIDWNGDGDFSDTLETAAAETPGRALSWTDTISVPAFAKVGATVMRVALTQGTQISDPCSNSYGEYEDYRLYITNDMTPPVITMIGADTIRVEQGYPFSDPGATASDNLSGNLTSKIIVNKGGFDILTQGTYVFTYNVKDDAGNAAVTKKRVVIVTPDVTAADLQIDADDTIMVGVFTSFTEPTSSAWDLVDGDLSADVKVSDPVNINVVDTYTIAYSVVDANNNVAKKNIVVIVADTTAPALTLNGASTIYHDVNTPYSDSGVVYNDNYYKGGNWDSLMKSRIQTQSNVDVTKVGTYTVTYSLTDPSGNKATDVTRTVIVQDTMAPAVTMNGSSSVTLEVFDVLNDMGINIKDNYCSTFTVDTLGDFYTNFQDGKALKLGKYTIVYKVTDCSGNVSTVTREVNVVDTKAPVISLQGGPAVNVCRWGTYQDSGYTVSDNYWATSDITVTQIGTFVNTQTLSEGLFTLQYKAVDKSGNVAYSELRYINVLSPEDPSCYTGIADAKELDRYFTVYPNPSTGMFTVTSNLPNEKEVRITVTNLVGQQIAVANSQVLGKGQFQVDLSNQASGVYLLNIYTSNQVITKRIVISK